MLLCACLVVFAPSCVSTRRATGPAGKEHKVIEETTGQEHKVVEETTRQAQANIASGEYKKALERYSAAYQKYHSGEMRDSYAGTGEQIWKIAESAYQRKDFAEAGAVYSALLESGITTRDFAHTLSFDDDHLNGQMKACSKALLETGLTTYRDGKLEDAISLWKKALVFDRDNKDIKSAIETATTQLQNLKHLK
jgi:tetratricopeptide (TPR) repeat protein